MESLERHAAPVRAGAARLQRGLLQQSGTRLEWPPLDEPRRGFEEPQPGPREPARPPEPEAPDAAGDTPAELEEMLARARTEAAEETERAVREALLASLEQRQADALALLARALAEAQGRYDDMVRACATDAKELALALAGALAPRALALAPLADIETMLQDVVARLHEQPRLELRLAPALVEPARGLLARIAAEAGYGGDLDVVAESALGPGEARLQWRHGFAERDLARLAAEARALVDAWLPDGTDRPGEQEDERPPGRPAAVAPVSNDEGTDE